MSCLIYASDGQGNCIGRCDASCYEAREPQCDCICGGVNHGKGLTAAQINTSRYAEKWMNDYKKRYPNVKTFGFDVDPDQLKLF